MTRHIGTNSRQSVRVPSRNQSAEAARGGTRQQLRARLARWIVASPVRSLFGWVAAGTVGLSVWAAGNATAQDACCFQPAYRLQCDTVMQPQTVQRFRIAHETEMVEEEIVSLRPVLRTRTEEREVRVARPVVETNYREERYTIQRPVIETSYRDEEYTETRYVTETSEREERVTSFRPITETQMHQQRHVVQRPVVETQFQTRQHVVQRPVVETQFQTQQHVVQRPVVETQFQTQQHVVQRPVTTVQNQTVDRGGFVNQQFVQPGQTTFGLQWVPRAVQTTGPLGIFSVNRGAAVWTPQVTPPTVTNQTVYQPNWVTQQVAQTSFVPEVQQQQVPVQVMRMHTETVSQQVPVQVTRMQSETVTEQVPVQVMRMQSEVVSQDIPVTTTRMEPVVEIRKVPVTVQRPVTETKTRRVPIQQQRWVSEEQVRRVPVTTTRIEYETRKEPVEVKYFEQERVVQKVRRPVTRQIYVPYTETVMVPRQVVQRAPLSYYDPFSSAIVSGYSTLESTTIGPASVSPAPSSSPAPSNGAPSVAPPIDSVYRQRPEVNGDQKPSAADSKATQDADEKLGPSVLSGPENADDSPRPRVQGVEISSPSDRDNDTLLPPRGDASRAGDSQNGEKPNGAAGDQPNGTGNKSNGGAKPSDQDEVDQPLLEANSATYRIRYRPQFSRSL